MRSSQKYLSGTNRSGRVSPPPLDPRPPCPWRTTTTSLKSLSRTTAWILPLYHSPGPLPTGGSVDSEPSWVHERGFVEKEEDGGEDEEDDDDRREEESCERKEKEGEAGLEVKRREDLDSGHRVVSPLDVPCRTPDGARWEVRVPESGSYG